MERKNNNERINLYTGKEYSKQYWNILEKRTQLPVYKYKSDFCDLLCNNQFVVLVGETGKFAV
jgi:pre-mRNA-splicing factor ATP-dependent RNA helicase DHX15/PRP43